MKNLIFACLFVSLFFSCKEAPKDAAADAASADSTAIAASVHGFYQWYDGYVQDNTKQVDFVITANNHYALDLSLLDKYLANIQASGFVSSELLASDKSFYQACEKLWQNEAADGPATGMDGNKYFCAQDWDINFWTTSPVRINSLDADKAAVTLYGTEGGSPKEQNMELKKENGKWLLTKIECDMGLDADAGSEQTQVEQLAAFYTGSLPCQDCEGIETMLTLNADEKRTFTLEEKYKGKKPKTIESTGTWTVAGDLVTLTQNSGSTIYQITADGLVSLNADGSERDAASAEKYLLKKVIGE
ncbi:MAG: copper resistance protein NlpE N-terminal domain-containing protein [Saprospiraceae bacterium]|nr:copper resistance protein NlpE N-terminal domain-containing protein [Saprospiraceae bacterium]MCF8443324.1 copper resistance protein NlpE N-terminal domain-containing protein [Saprospiraceae bacterium]